MDLWDLLVPVSLGLRALRGSEDRLAFQEPEGCQVKRDPRERRARRGSAPAPPETWSSLACRVLPVFLDHQAPLECLGCREYLETTACQDSRG